jgi:hypothetical protein
VDCAGDPINHTDPTGHTLKVVGGNAEQRGEYRREKVYLRKSNVGNQLIRKLKQSKKVFTIKFVYGADENRHFMNLHVHLMVEAKSYEE